jgi:hypothetical protein
MARRIPEEWLPPCIAERVIVHWTGGGNYPSAVDAEHYHLLVDRVGGLHRGEHSIADNLVTEDDDYAAHTRGLNRRSVGLALCGMADASAAPFAPGPFPLRAAQWNAALWAAADLCRRYRIPADERHLLMHCEVARFLGVPQSGKWDVSIRSWDAGAWARLTPGEELRARVGLLLRG